MVPKLAEYGEMGDVPLEAENKAQPKSSVLMHVFTVRYDSCFATLY